MENDLNKIKFDDLKKTLSVDKKRGIVGALGREILLISRDTFSMLISSIYDVLGTGASSVLYQAGKRIGRNFAKINMKVSDNDPEKAWNNIKTRDATSGWGIYKLEKISFDEKKAYIKTKNNIIYRTGLKIRCDLLAGYFSGIFSEIFGDDVICIEKKCAKFENGEWCEFMIARKIEELV